MVLAGAGARAARGRPCVPPPRRYAAAGSVTSPRPSPCCRCCRCWSLAAGLLRPGPGLIGWPPRRTSSRRTPSAGAGSSPPSSAARPAAARSSRSGPAACIVGGIALVGAAARRRRDRRLLHRRAPQLAWLEPGSCVISKETRRAVRHPRRQRRPGRSSRSQLHLRPAPPRRAGADANRVSDTYIREVALGPDLGIDGAPTLPAAGDLIDDGWTACTAADAGIQLTLDRGPGHRRAAPSRPSSSAAVARCRLVAPSPTGSGYRLELPDDPTTADVIAGRLGFDATLRRHRRSPRSGSTCSRGGRPSTRTPSGSPTSGRPSPTRAPRPTSPASASATSCARRAAPTSSGRTAPVPLSEFAAVVYDSVGSAGPGPRRGPAGHAGRLVVPRRVALRHPRLRRGGRHVRRPAPGRRRRGRRGQLAGTPARRGGRDRHRAPQPRGRRRPVGRRLRPRRAPTRRPPTGRRTSSTPRPRSTSWSGPTSRSPSGTPTAPRPWCPTRGSSSSRRAGRCRSTPRGGCRRTHPRPRAPRSDGHGREDGSVGPHRPRHSARARHAEPRGDRAGARRRR